MGGKYTRTTAKRVNSTRSQWKVSKASLRILKLPRSAALIYCCETMALVAACWKVALQVVSEQGGYLPKIDTTWVNCWNKLVQEA